MPTPDLGGQWNYLGLLTPLFEEWQEYPTPTESNNETIRLTFYFPEIPQKIGSFGYLRQKFVMTNLHYSRWTRFYPSPESSILTLPIPTELKYSPDPITRYIQVMKRNKYRRPNWTVIDQDWSVAIEQFDLIATQSLEATLLETIGDLDTIRQRLIELEGS